MANKMHLPLKVGDLKTGKKRLRHPQATPSDVQHHGTR